MSTTPIIPFLSALTTLPAPLQEAIEKRVVREVYKPHQIVHAAGHTENRCWYVTSGLARTYYLDQAGKEHTLAFYREGQMIWSVQGFWNEPADYYLEVLEPAVWFALPYRSFNELTATFPQTGSLVQALTRQQYHQELSRNRLLALPAEERYLQLRKTLPELFRRVSVRLLASYLNMTRENLSRLMARDL
ncbi:Crp/Fnr family transcriptional regulator [Mucilaginibacter sp. HD30]